MRYLIAEFPISLLVISFSFGDHREPSDEMCQPLLLPCLSSVPAVSFWTFLPQLLVHVRLTLPCPLTLHTKDPSHYLRLCKSVTKWTENSCLLRKGIE
ncbi:hypothetical protein U0070_004086 [Myodes glareolus]|uniref:Secreted protein n=1 Tax=Myodes glareolus TaxID=447135 RepID=A0AAW0KBB4_MYOGA